MDAERRPVCERSRNRLILASAQDLWWPSALGPEQAHRQSPVAGPPYSRYFVTPQSLGSGPSPAILASPFHLTKGIPVQPSLDIARVGSSRGRSSVKNLTSGENRSYLVSSVRGTRRTCFISGERGLVCPEFKPCRNAPNPSRGVQRK